MIEILKKENCSGCSACASACPKNCIEMKGDEEGFRYPLVDKDKCINCHVCEKVCPIVNLTQTNNKPIAFLTRTKDSSILEKATSGGIFTTIAKNVVESGGVAYGAVYDENFKVVHTRVTDSNKVILLAGSKYVQSDMHDVFSKVKADLEEGNHVAFCGTPCQVAGLKSYLGREYDTLLLVDLICHGVPSPKLWEKYTEYLQTKKGKLKRVNFRSKHLGYHVSVMEEQFENGHVQFGSARTNLMSKCFFRNVADRPICYECPFKTISRVSDLTLFDGWHASKYVKDLKDDDLGFTIVLSQSEKGKRFIKESELFIKYPIDVEMSIETDGKMANNSVSRPGDRDRFYRLLDEIGIERTVQELLPIKKSDYIIEYVKICLNKLGVLPRIKRMIEKRRID